MKHASRVGLNVSLYLLSALLVEACGSHNGTRLASDGAAESDAGTSTGNEGCRGQEQPDADCAFGTPTYICVQRQGGWVWDATCPEPARDAGSSQADAVESRVLECEDLALKLRSEMSPVIGSCTAVVRFDYTSLRIISHAFVCGKYASTNESAARQIANTVSLPFTREPGAGTLLSGAPAGHWIFYTSPSDFGAVVSVSSLTGMATFAGSIVWSGAGEIELPKTWSTTDLGKGCNTPNPVDMRYFNLTGGEVADGQATARMQEAARIVLSTALPTAFLHWGSPFGTTVLLYPRTVGSFNPDTAEVIVLFDGGWLE